MSCLPLMQVKESQTWRNGVQSPLNPPWQRWNFKHQSQHQESLEPAPEAPVADPLEDTSTSHLIQTLERELQALTGPRTIQVPHLRQTPEKGYQTTADREMKEDEVGSMTFDLLRVFILIACRVRSMEKNSKLWYKKVHLFRPLVGQVVVLSLPTWSCPSADQDCAVKTLCSTLDTGWLLPLDLVWLLPAVSGALLRAGSCVFCTSSISRMRNYEQFRSNLGNAEFIQTISLSPPLANS